MTLDRNVACANCFKIYDANQNNQCPRCGACGRCDVNKVPEDSPYNTPQEAGDLDKVIELNGGMGWEMGGGYEERPKAVTFDNVETVKHYQVFPEYKLEARHIIARCIQLSGLKGDQAYHYGNALKYLLRLNRKGEMVEDASKAQEYLGYMKE